MKNQNSAKKRRLYRVIREGNYTNFPGFYGMLMRNCYTFPLSSNRDTMKKFLSSMDTVLQHGDFMLGLSGAEYVVELPQAKNH